MSNTVVNGSGNEIEIPPIEQEASGDVETGIIGESMDGEDDHDLEAVEEIAGMALRGDITVDDIKAGLQALSGGIATSQDVENAARAEEGLAPIDQELPLDFGPFNSDAALKAIFEKSAEVRELQADYDRKKDAAKDAKSELDTAAKALVNIIESLKNRRTQALNPTQPYLRDVAGDAPSSSPCPWERDHPGQTCPVCSEAKAVNLQPALESEVHPEHEGHAATAERARVQNVLEPLRVKLEAVNLFVETAELAGLSTEDLNALESYATEPSVIPPHIFAKTCVADAPGSLMQMCTTCGMALRSEADNAAEGRGWFPEGARVGFDCAGKDVASGELVVDGATPIVDEALRKPRSHAKKDGKKKAAPEMERQTQRAEGAKRSKAKPKAKSSNRSIKTPKRSTR